MILIMFVVGLGLVNVIVFWVVCLINRMVRLIKIIVDSVMVVL